MFLLIGALSVSISWIIFRHEPFSWILQDILGFSFCVTALKTLHMPNLKVNTHDVFYVSVRFSLFRIS